MSLFKYREKILVSMLVACVGVFYSLDASAVSGGGNDSGGIIAGCGFMNAYTLICNGNEGGASWHIYSTEDYSGPDYVDNNNILEGDIEVKDIKNSCPAKDYGWYIAYGWDGRNAGSGYRHIGPAKHNAGTIAGAAYNSFRGALSFEQTKKLVQGTLTDGPANLTSGYGRQLQDDVAKELYGLMSGTTIIPSDVGYFCFSEKKFGSQFQGLSTVVNGYDESHNDWDSVTDNNRKVKTDYIPGGNKNMSILEISGCNDGCPWVRFGHGLRRISGDEGTKYRVNRYVNDASIDPQDWVVGGDNEFESVSDFNGTNQKVVRSELQTMYTGQTICEQIDFYADGKNSLKGSTACAFAVGTVDTTLNIKVKNSSLGQVEYGRMTYARPGDNIDFLATYDPKVQGLVDRVPEKMQIDGVWKTNADRKTLKDAYDANNEGDADWNNAFTVYSEGFSSVGLNKTYNYAIGDSSEKTEQIPTHIVSQAEVGRELKEIVNINENDHGSTTPKQVRFFNDNGSLAADVITGEYDVNNDADLVANVVVPYNFINNVDIDAVDGNYASAGEIIKIPSTVITSPKNNSLVGGDPYATVVRNAKLRVRMCADEDCLVEYSKSEKEIGELHNDVDKFANSSKNIRGDESPSISVPDLPAGTEIYVSVDVYPAESDDNKWNDEKGNGRWSDPKQVKVIVAKSPSFQVWGGDVFVKESVNIPLANKAVLDGYNSDPAGPTYRFGSWGELSVGIGSDSGRGNLFSGAALGFAGNIGGELSPKYSFLGDYSKTAFYRGPGNNESHLEVPGGRIINNGNSSDRGDLNYSGGSMINIGALVSKLDGKVKVTSEGVEMVGADIPDMESGDSIMYKNDSGTITINGDIKYSGSYNTIDSIPKVIIYADNIKIACNVERIDAVLIAERNIETCPFAEGDEKKNNLGSPARSAQLRINGAVIAGGTVSFDRSYGAGTGANSMIPAEIINMDPSWYLWAADSIGISGTSMEHDDTEGLMIPTYTCELPPRY